MNRARTIAAFVAGFWFIIVNTTTAQLDDHIWVGGTGNQQWQENSNWQLNGMSTTFPNDPGRVDPDPSVISNVEGANLSVNLGANLNVDVGSTDITIAALTMGSTSGAVATNITSSGGRLIFENFEQNNTVPEPDECAFNCGRALITSQGVSGATNTISALVGVNDHIDVAGPKPITLAGGLEEMAGASTTGDVSLSARLGSTVFITGGITTLNIPVGASSEDIPLALNGSSDSQGTIDVTGVISGAGRMRYGTAISGATRPFGQVILRNANTYTGRTILSRGNLVLANDNALGTGDVKHEGPAEGGLQTGYNLLSDNDNRTIANDLIIAQWTTVKGEHSLTWAGRVYQDNRRGWINMLPAGKTLTLSGPQFPNHTEENPPLPGRDITFDGSGKTVVTGSLHNELRTADNTVDPGTFVGSYKFRGTGTVVLSSSASTYTGTTIIEGANVHFATNASFGSTSRFISEAGAVGVDSGVIGNSTFLGKLNNSSSPEADAAGNFNVFDRGGLMLGTGEYGMNLDFTSGALANAGDMSLAAHETGSTYTGTITPRNNTYRLGGGSGTLTLPNNNQLTGARNVVATNGGVVNITGTNNYTGTTSIIAKFVTTLQNAASQDTINFVDGDNIPNDQIYLGTTLAATTLANGGSASSIGSSSNAASNLYIQGSTLQYVGGPTSTDRLFTIGSNGATIDASGSGPISFTNTGALGVDVAEDRTGNVNAFATGNSFNDRSTIRNLSISTEDLAIGMPISSPNAPNGIPAGTTITRILGPNDVQISQLIGDFAFSNNTLIRFGAAPERKLTLTGSNAGNNTLASLIQDNPASNGGTVGVTKNGAGKWILTGNNTYTGATTVNAGTLLINGNQSAATGLTTVSAGGTLGGTGTLGGGLTNSGIVNPGNGVGTLTVNGNVTMAADSRWVVELLGSTADRLTINGNLDLSATGNILDVLDLGKTGSSWVIATYTGTLTGIFESITSGYTVDYGTGTNSQITLMAAAGLAGDYNQDGRVNAADYVLWRKNPAGFGGNPGGYNTWKSNFGAVSGSGTSATSSSSAVPEPTTAMLFSLVCLGVLAGWRRWRG